MSIYKRCAVMMLLFAGLAACAFGDVFYSFTTGLYRFMEWFPSDNYGREHNGVNANFTLYYFPQNFPLGVFAQTSFAGPVSSYEWQDDSDMTTMVISSITDVRIIAAPSFKFQLGEKVRIPLSVGPSVDLYRETNDSRLYEAVGMGLFGDVSLIVNPSSWFFLRHGVSFEWDFLRAERGKMATNYRTFSNGGLKRVSYSAIVPQIYLGIGIRFE